MRDDGLVDAEVRDDGRREVLDELRELVAVARVDAVELRAAQAPAGRHEVDADDLAGPRPLLEELRDARAELSPIPVINTRSPLIRDPRFRAAGAGTE